VTTDDNNSVSGQRRPQILSLNLLVQFRAEIPQAIPTADRRDGDPQPCPDSEANDNQVGAPTIEVSQGEREAVHMKALQSDRLPCMPSGPPRTCSVAENLRLPLFRYPELRHLG